MNVPLSRLLPMMVGGTAVAGLENQFIGTNLPPELKKVNLGIGATTGALMSLGPKGMLAGLAGIPLKQSLLFGVGGLEKLRRQQQELTDTNLEAAKIRKDTAGIEQRNAGSHNLMTAAFMVPAFLGSGALAYYALNQRKHEKAKGSGRFKTISERGDPIHNPRKIRIDVPPAALPDDFFKALINGEENPRSRIQVMEKASSFWDNPGGDINDVRQEYFDPVPRAARGLGQSLYDSTPGRAVRTGGRVLAEMTGVPSVVRAAQDLGSGLGHMAGGQPGVGARYLMGGAGNALLAVPNIRWMGLPMAGKMLGRSRLLRQVDPTLVSTARTALGRQLDPKVLTRRFITGQPHLAQAMLDNMHGLRSLSAAERTALKDPATRKAMVKALYNSPGLKGNQEILSTLREAKYPFSLKPWDPAGMVGYPPKSLAGEAYFAGRRGLHAARNAHGGLYTMAHRFPNASMMLMGMPLAPLGHVRDEEKLKEFMTMHRDELPQLPGYGPGHLPNAWSFQRLLDQVGPQTQAQVGRELSGAPVDPYAWMTYRR